MPVALRARGPQPRKTRVRRLTIAWVNLPVVTVMLRPMRAHYRDSDSVAERLDCLSSARCCVQDHTREIGYDTSNPCARSAMGGKHPVAFPRTCAAGPR